ncbi:MAG: hypothetical protein IT373_31765 [Polyangiaceae bacterium]|nr:hypothetical protein [Polyangiaceae bacterium]
MSGMSRSVQCIVVNETEFELVGTLSGGKLNWDLLHGSFDGGIDAPPCPIAAGARAEFTTSTAGLFTGTEGWVVYELKGQGLIVQVSWNEPFIGSNSYTLGVNKLASATRELEPVPVSFTDRNGKPISFAEAEKADDVIATYTVRLKPLVAEQATPPAPPPIERGPADAVTPNKETSVFDDLPAWARKLSEPRKKLLASLAHIIPQSTGGGAADYDQGGKMVKSAWWTGEGRGTSCTGYNPKVMQAFYQGGTDPYPDKWAFNAGGAAAWEDKEGKKYPKVDPHPKWKGVEKHPPPEMPGPGDTYILFIDYQVGDLPAGIRHVGNIVYAPETPDATDDCWVTADGGQRKKGVHCQLVPRLGIFGPAKQRVPMPNTLHFRGGAEALNAPATTAADDKAFEQWQEAEAKKAKDWEGKSGTPPITKSPRTKNLPHLIGWVPTDDLTGFDPSYSKDDFKDVVQRIEKVRAYWLQHKK